MTLIHVMLRVGPVLGSVMAFLLLAPRAQADVRDADVDATILTLIGSLREDQIQEDVIVVNGFIQMDGRREAVRSTYRGRTLRKTRSRLTFETVRGQRFEVDPLDVTWKKRAGMFAGETANHAQGGRTALATLALLTAGLSRHDATVHAALEALWDHPMPGTYGRSLRVSIYATLLDQAPASEQKKLFELLRADARWLVAAALPHGGYTYTNMSESDPARLAAQRHDNSNSQFGMIGVWVAELAGVKISPRYWSRVETLWLVQQHADGGWSYKPRKRASQNMTIAGINALTVVLDREYTRTSGDYLPLVGLPRQTRVWSEVQRIERHIDRGLQWLKTHPDQNESRFRNSAYTQLALERLGYASGRKYLGDRDWFRDGARRAVLIDSWRSHSLQERAMWLMFLAHGRAPVLFNKLRWGGAESGWDTYYRDLHHGCRYLTRRYEQRYKWQIIDTSATMDDMRDAPLLYVAGSEELDLPADMLSRVRRHVERGGTVVGHANHNSAAFADSFKTLFAAHLPGDDRGFRKLSPAHALFRAALGGSVGPGRAGLSLWGLSDGVREIAVLIEQDIAGAWHQDLHSDHPDLFGVLANLRMYTAPAYERLPERLRPPTVRISPPIARVHRVLGVEMGAGLAAARAAWTATAERLEQGRISRVSFEEVPLERMQGRQFDVVHVVGRGARPFNAPDLQALRRHAAAGGWLLIEAHGADVRFATTMRTQLEQEIGLHWEPLGPEHPWFGGRSFQPRLNRWARSLGPEGLLAATWPGGGRVLLAGADVSYGAAGVHVFELAGFDSLFSQSLLIGIAISGQSAP